MVRKVFTRQIATGLVITGFYFLTGFVLDLIHPFFMSYVMIWNVFLAVLPLLLAAGAKAGKVTQHRLVTLVFFLAWLFFFPNALYLITDFIHTNSSDFYQIVAGSAEYIKDINAWLEFLYIGTGVLLGSVIGIYSLEIIYDTFLQPLKKKFALAWLLLIGLAAGYGVYLGRFLRLNTWDLIHPIQLILRIVQTDNLFAFQFSVLIAGYMLFLFAVLHFCHFRAKKSIQ